MIAILFACSSPTVAHVPSAAPVPVPAIEPFVNPTGAGADTPSLSASGDALWMSWQERVGDGGRVRVSRHVGGSWSEPVTAGESPRLLVNWADHPAVVADGRGGVWLHWLELGGEAMHAYDIVLAHAPDGATFRTLGAPHRDGTATEHGFVSLVPEGGGVRAFWVDGRATVAGGPSAIRTARVDAAGIGPDEVLDDRACDCCATAAVATASGPLVAYRDRTETEVRDVKVARVGSAAPPFPAGEGWTIDGCPVNGPAMDRQGDLVAAAWFTAAGEIPRVRASVSSNGGAAFAAAIDVDAGEAGEPMGRVDVAVGEDGSAVVVWLRKAGDHADVVVRRVGPKGMGEPRTIGTTSLGRASGFPQLVAWQQGYVAAWTVPGESSRVESVRFGEAAVPPAE